MVTEAGTDGRSVGRRRSGSSVSELTIQSAVAVTVGSAAHRYPQWSSADECGPQAGVAGRGDVVVLVVAHVVLVVAT
jgi:hypothetical protein